MNKKDKQNLKKKNDYIEEKNEFKVALGKNKYFWLSGLCLLYFLKIYNPAFAWFGAFGALAFYKNSNKYLSKLIYISILGLIGFIGLFIS
ncbi:MAG: hypothetical protein ACOWWH_13775 [Eubacteriaceae bacterium]